MITSQLPEVNYTSTTCWPRKVYEQRGRCVSSAYLGRSAPAGLTRPQLENAFAAASIVSGRRSSARTRPCRIRRWRSTLVGKGAPNGDVVVGIDGPLILTEPPSAPSPPGGDWSPVPPPSRPSEEAPAPVPSAAWVHSLCQLPLS